MQGLEIRGNAATPFPEKNLWSQKKINQHAGKKKNPENMTKSKSFFPLQTQVIKKNLWFVFVLCVCVSHDEVRKPRLMQQLRFRSGVINSWNERLEMLP